ncbi:RICIN domain-containing protein [Streptomyces tsukubensis]|uniref:Ricin B lectin domain-containing protein n=1 Tax=Streptomyces tsukubensis TaxID=83656 RepID=A0A1V4A514_9ACTN|nr:RICIN domain-containing protein [Streptomyces tsukubensis]OON76206.1 hypothetical protein B1H18_21535 [Streptomyces tsukubensis]QFR93729.1 hypothetical protein GBW32_12350 [Streptomyces tsukubensis]
MSEAQSEDEKRRERARRVDALSDAARQPGEGPRFGTRVAGAIAVLALAAGATLGVGAWHSYQNESDQKKAEAAKLQAKEVAAHQDISPSPSPSESKKEKKKQEIATQPQSVGGGPAAEPQKESEKPADGATKKPKETVEKPEAKVKLTPKANMAAEGFSRVVLANKSTRMCADLPGADGHPEGDGMVDQYPCDASDNDNQLWNVTVSHAGVGPGGTDLVLIANVKDGLCLDLPYYGAQDVGARVQEHACTSSMQDNQQWRFEDMPDGSKRIHNYASKGLCLKVAYDGLDRVNTPLTIGDCQAPSAEWFLRR